ncbi:Gfo/Idh/MocA family oxidoreductase [Streptomyces thinghirensis]|nr:Gfo/Idh/MocA family oxidoreductase [Streptomyces thinghirensis]
MKVGVIGLGDIAQKAYLPVLRHAARGRTAPADPHPRDAHPRRRRTAPRGRAAPRRPRLLLAEGLDAAFVHAPTAVHPEIVTRLLEAGVPAYVDKPLAYELADSSAW